MQKLVRNERGMILLVLLHAHVTGGRLKISQSSIFGLYTIININQVPKGLMESTPLTRDM